ncbi:hypothetical protein DERP_005224 [Dermatophagoides pteronyssinus]|uniref:Uncharacterized protein n=1 Tax=Dermatophagoides pteronyssinus TaxID=6956 RepID=A0ABQ8JM74_DERPT|nr:hypothetical protein DERP_005224 [Dermatophagoides pteronyssinus]
MTNQKLIIILISNWFQKSVLIQIFIIKFEPSETNQSIQFDFISPLHFIINKSNDDDHHFFLLAAKRIMMNI